MFLFGGIILLLRLMQLMFKVKWVGFGGMAGLG